MSSGETAVDCSGPPITPFQEQNSCEDDACGDAPEEKYIYESCSGGDPIVATESLLKEGQVATHFWIACEWYKVPEGTSPTTSNDTVGVTQNNIHFPIPGLDCDQLLNYNIYEWRACGTEENVFQTVCCTQANPSPDLLTVGTAMNNFPEPYNEGCYELAAITNESILPTVECPESNFFECGTIPCE
jgi:hypothetical protein